MVSVPGRNGGARRGSVDYAENDGGPVKPKLPAKVSAKWDELVSQIPAVALRKIDSHELAILAGLLALSDTLSRKTDEKGRRLWLNTIDRIHRMSAVFGLNPADRKRLGTTLQDEKQESPMKELLDRMKGGSVN